MSQCRRAILAGVCFVAVARSAAAFVTPVVELLPPRQVTLRGILGRAVNASYQGRLKHFVKDAKSEPIILFSPAVAAKNFAGDWNGEHAGKWLYTAARAASRTADPELAATVRLVADYLVSQQEPTGYLGAYAPTADSRMTSPNVAGKRTWDVWVHAYMIIGLLEVNRFFPDEKYVRAARRIGDLCYELLVVQGRAVTDMGSHVGLSATILLEPVIDLYRATGEKRYLDLANRILDQTEAKPGLEIISRSLKGTDLQGIGDGKVYQLLWNFTGIAKLYEVSGRQEYWRVTEQAWKNVVEQHLTPGGGPWGGAGGNYELFNPRGIFSPYGMVETCSTMSWIHLNRDLLRLSGDPKYADEIEKTIYNSLLGAQHPNGEDWAYFVFPNGRRSNTYYWACCKSSGALALEEIAPLVFGKREGGIVVNLYSESEARLEIAGAPVHVAVATGYPRDGEVTVTVNPAKQAAFPLFIRIPAWAAGTRVMVNGAAHQGAILAGSYLKLEREWRPGDRVVANFPLRLRVEQKAESIDHHGQVIAELDYMALTRGPLAYAAGLIDGYKTLETLKLPRANPEIQFSPCRTPEGFDGPAVQLNLPGREPIVFLPYYEAGGRSEGKWRATWLQVAWQ